MASVQQLVKKIQGTVARLSVTSGAEFDRLITEVEQLNKELRAAKKKPARKPVALTRHVTATR